jgi:hypothetical protein
VSAQASQWRELARTAGDGVAAALLWNESVNRAKVAVSDERLCHFVDFELRGAEALSAFHRPFVDVAAQLTGVGRRTDKEAIV